MPKKNQVQDKTTKVQKVPKVPNKDPKINPEKLALKKELTHANKALAQTQAELTQAQTSVKEYWEQLLRLKAEMENQKKRQTKALEDAHKYALDRFIKELMTVKDSLDIALQQNQQASIESRQEGLAMIDKTFMDVLEKFGISPINPLGQKFDPQFHEAITMVPKKDKQSDEVVEVAQIGMTLNGRLLRAARVIVAQ